MNFQLRRISTSTLLFFSIIGGSVLWARAITLSLFVDQVGANRLPLALLLDGFSIILIAILYSQFTRRLDRPILLWLVSILVTLLILLGSSLDTSGIIILFIAQRIFSDIFSKYSHQYVAYFYSARHDREGFLESLLTSRALQGLIAIALIPMSFVFTPGELLNWWLGAVLVSSLMVIWVSDSLRYIQRTVDTLPEYGDVNPHFKSSGNLPGLVKGRLIRWLTLMALAVSVIASLLLFQSLLTLETRIDDFAALVTFFSVVNGVGIWLSLPLKYVALTRLLRQLNAGRLTALFPTVASAAFWAVVLFPSVLTAGLSEFSRTALRLSFYEPLERILHHALPGGVEGWSKRFIDSYVEPAGHILGALILFGIIESGMGTNELLFAIGTGVAIIAMISAARSGHLYGLALSASLDAGQYRVLRHTASEWGPSDMTTIHTLIDELDKQPLDSRESLMIAEVIAESHVKEGYEALTSRFQRCPPHIKAELLSIIITGWSDLSMRKTNQQLIENALRSEHPDLRRTTLRLVATFPELDPSYQVAQLLVDRDPEVNIVSASVLMRHPSIQIREAARSQLRWLSGHRQASVRVSAVKSLVSGSLNKFGEIIYPVNVERFLNDPATRVREAALGAATMPQLIRSVCDPSQNVRRTAIRQLTERRFEGARRHIMAALVELDAVDAMSPHVQIENSLCRWRLHSALANVSLRYGKAKVLGVLHDGFGHLDLIDSMAYTLRKLDRAELSPLIKQLQLDYTTLLQGMMEFLAFVYDERQVNAAMSTLMSADAEEQRKTARRILMHLTDEQYAMAFETCLHVNAGEHERLESGLPRSVMEAMLGQYDDWRPLLTLYTIINLPAENRTWFEIAFAEHLLEERIQSTEPAIREAARFIQQRLHDQEAPTRMEEYTEEVIEEVVMLSMLERMVFLRNVSFFGNLRIDQLRALARVCDELAFAEGKRIITQGEHGDGLFIVVEGQVSIVRHVPNSEPITLLRLTAPEVFGEISLLDGGVRTADVVADTPVLLLGIKREALDDALQDDPSIAMGMLRSMAERVRRTTETIDKHATTLNAETVRDFTQRPE